MNALLRAAACCLLTLAAPARTQDPPWRFGVLFWHESPNDEAAFEGLKRGLEATGHAFELDVQRADSDPERAAALLAGFRESGVDLVFALGTEAALLAKEHVRDTPVVFTAVTNPVTSGVVPSWDGAGEDSNLAGNSNWIEPETVLRVFQLAVPDLRRLGILRSTEGGRVSAAELAGMRRYLEQSGEDQELEIFEAVVQSVDDLGRAATQLLERDVQALWIPIDFLVYQNIDRVLAAVGDERGVPLLASSLRGTRNGAVAGILVDYRMLGERAAVLARDILRDDLHPGRQAIGTMRGYQVVVHLGAARRLGYTPPLSLLVLADQILDAGGQER